jgi:AcrR family transcriptional regulator
VHHFRTRTELFAQTIEHLAQHQQEALDRRLKTLPTTASAAEVLLELVSVTFAGKLGKASAQLYVNIANDDELRRNMLRVQHATTTHLLDACARRIGPAIPRERLDAVFWLTINLVRGATVDDMLGRDNARRKQVLEDWLRLASIALSDQPPTSVDAG